QILGKISWDDKKLVENYQTMLSVLPKNQIKSVYICSTMGPSVKVSL
ncbi:MAG: 50S ribosomal protein L1, partial [Candidatus Nealsonbacteria bacterium CG23_combo_of_CG06-09_8_20_14_all_40_13]